jgi:hypothetical protein
MNPQAGYGCAHHYAWSCVPVCRTPDYSSGSLGQAVSYPITKQSAPPPLFQVASVTIDDYNRRAIITAVGGTQFEVNDDGVFPVQVSPTTGRRLLKKVRRQL